MAKCRNCDAPLGTARFCPECGADSKAQKFSTDSDLIAENARLKEELEKKKDFIPRPPDDADNDI